MTDKKCRWGFLSTAEIGRKNWQAIKFTGNSELVAVASRNVQKAQDFIDDCQSHVPFPTAPTALGDYGELIEHPDVDAVYIPLPTGMRKEWVIRAANAGKHVLCEKPCAGNADDLAEMVEACRANNVQFMDGVMYMHTERLNSLRQSLDDGESVGQIKRITTQFSFCAPEDFKTGNIRTDAKLEPHGCLGDLGWYTIRFILWTMNYAMPTTVSGRLLTEHRRDPEQPGVPMEFSGELFFDNGVSAMFYNSFITEHQQWASIAGTKGQIYIPDYVLPYHSNQLKYRITKPSFTVNGCDFNMEDNTRWISTLEYSSSAANAAETNLFRRFSNNVNSGNIESHWPEISLKTQTVLDRCFESARNDSSTLAL